jgi:TonB-linked SusC/RagA family outer membrane protein
MKKMLSAFMLFMFLTGNIAAQNISIKGVVRSATDSEPLIGVSVIVKGTSNGTATDRDGAFSLSVQTGDVLTFTYLGYLTQEIAVGNRTAFDVVMQEDDQALDEVVVIGYGVQKKSLVSGAIVKVSSADIEKMMPTRLEDVLNGKVAGLSVMQTSGQPGAGSDMRIRGIGTVNSSDPLYIVDGMQIEGNINYLNPKDIASVEVLKDAASAAIYGTRGANGIIFITTKQGVKGQRTVNYDFSYGWQNPWKKKEILNAPEYMTLMNEMQVNDGGQIRFTADEIANAKTTDWQDEIFYYDAPIVNHNVSMTGGSDTNLYAVSFGYLKQDGIIGGNFGKSNLERYNFRINDKQTAFETNTRNFLNKLQVGVNLGYTHGKNASIDANSEFGSILGSALVFAPYLPVYAADPDETLKNYPNAVKDKNGRVFTIPLASDKYQEIGNPVAMLNNTSQYEINEEDVFVGGVWGELAILEGLKFHSSYSVDMSFWGNNGYNMPYYIAPQGKNIEDLEHSNIYGAKNKRFTWQVENYLSWTEKFAYRHNIEVMLGQSAKKTEQSQIGGSRGMPTFQEHDLLLSMNNTLSDKTYYDVYGYYGGEYVNFYALASYFGRFNYNFDERYMLSASFRRDGTTRFGPDKKWGIFPAVSVAWNILNEPYIHNKPLWMDAVKLRASWGRNGNDRIGELRYTTVYARGNAYDYYFGGGFDPATNSWNTSRTSGVQPGAIENRVLAWEESEQTNIGLDILLLRNAFNFSFDWFKKSTIGMLQTAIIPPSAGQGAPEGNVGSMSNKGVEISAGYKVRIGKFNFFADANATYVKSVLDNYANATGIQPNIENQGNTGVGEYMRGQTGEVYPFFFGLKTDGLFQTMDDVNNYTYTYTDEAGLETTQLIQPNARPGDIRFVDTNNDGQITAADKVKIGKPMPDWVFGLTLGGDWRGFDFNLFFKGALGFQIFDYAQRGDISALNRPAWILQRWHGEGTSNSIPRMTAQNPNGNNNSSDLYMKDGAFLRLKAAQIGYTLPGQYTQIVSIQKLRLYVAAYNLLTFTGHDGFDIEMGNHNIDRGVYPQARTIALGATITF